MTPPYEAVLDLRVLNRKVFCEINESQKCFRYFIEIIEKIIVPLL